MQSLGAHNDGYGTLKVPHHAGGRHLRMSQFFYTPWRGQLKHFLEFFFLVRLEPVPVEPLLVD